MSMRDMPASARVAAPQTNQREERCMSQKTKRVFNWTSGTLCVLTLSFTIQAAMQNGPSDPGVRGGATGAGGAISGLSVKEAKFFQAGQDAFSEMQSVLGTISGTEAALGPRYNLD